MSYPIEKNKKYFVTQINSSKAYQFTCQYHYSKEGFKKAQVNLGVFLNTTKELVGVLQWGVSAQEGIRLDRYVKEPITTKEYLELNRFCMAEQEERNSESQAIGLAVKWIKHNLPHIKLLVSYAGRKEGNYGYIYQATNWEYLGYFISPGFWIVDGKEKHLITLYYQIKRHGKDNLNFVENLCKIYNSVKQTWTKQFIYIQRLDKKLTPAVEPLSYPKPATDEPILTKEKIYKDEPYTMPTQNNKIEFKKFFYDEDESLFTRAALVRRGEVKRRKDFKVAMYDSSGTLEGVYDSVAALVERYNEYAVNGINTAIREKKMYKKKYFYFVESAELAEEQLSDIMPICYINDIPYYTQKEIEQEFHITRQAVSAAKTKKSKTIGKKPVIWL